jgi:hypothetical protein
LTKSYFEYFEGCTAIALLTCWSGPGGGLSLRQEKQLIGDDVDEKHYLMRPKIDPIPQLLGGDK